LLEASGRLPARDLNEEGTGYGKSPEAPRINDFVAFD